MKITKNKLKQIIKEELEELDDASAHTIATGGETIENPKMPAGYNHYQGKGRYEDQRWASVYGGRHADDGGRLVAGSGDRAREKDLESIRVAGDIGEKPEPQQRWDISDETGVPVLRSDLDDALTSLSKDQVEQIIREAVAGALNESPGLFGADYSPAEEVKNIIAPEQAERNQAMTRNLESEYIINATSRDEEELKAIEWAKTAHPDDGSPRWADPLYTQAYDNRRQHALDNISDRDGATRPIRAVPRRTIDSTLEVDGKVPPTPQTRQVQRMEEQSALDETLKRWKKLIK